MKKQIDLNCDMGESFGVYSIGSDAELMTVITSANIACGAHAGDFNVMDQSVILSKENGVKVGAHPGYPDLAGFGRRMMPFSPEEIYRFMIFQIGSLQAFCKVHHIPLHHVKPHGALYNVAARDHTIADAIAKAVSDLDDSLLLYGLAGSELIAAGKKYGLTVANEVFADRTYQADGTLTPRSEKNALIEDVEKAVEQVKQMVMEGIVQAVDGSTVQVQADTVCIHGDNPQAVEFARKLKRQLIADGITVCAR